jgi:hypothetical protein
MKFVQTYEEICRSLNENDVIRIRCETGKKIEWPSGGGVYLVWKDNDKTIKNLLYVGLTGRHRRNNEGKIEFQGSNFAQRQNRWTPYRFCQNIRDDKFIYTFRFGPKEKNATSQGKIMYLPDAYKITIPYSKLLIVCLRLAENHDLYTPALCEALLLNDYLKDCNDLPPANNIL